MGGEPTDPTSEVEVDKHVQNIPVQDKKDYLKIDFEIKYNIIKLWF